MFLPALPGLRAALLVSPGTRLFPAEPLSSRERLLTAEFASSRSGPSFGGEPLQGCVCLVPGDSSAQPSLDEGYSPACGLTPRHCHPSTSGPELHSLECPPSPPSFPPFLTSNLMVQ